MGVGVVPVTDAMWREITTHNAPELNVFIFGSNATRKHSLWLCLCWMVNGDKWTERERES